MPPDAAGTAWAALWAWRGGDLRAAEALTTRYYAPLMRFFLNKVGSPEEATDLVSETLLGCVAGKERVARPGSFRSYLFAIAMNKLRGYYRKKVKRQRELDDFADVCVGDTHPRSPASVLARAEQAQLLVRALRRLTLTQQIVVELSVFESLRARQIGELLDVPESTVRTHLSRGRKRLAQLVEELAEEPGLAGSTLGGLATWGRQVRAQVGLEPSLVY